MQNLPGLLFRAVSGTLKDRKILTLVAAAVLTGTLFAACNPADGPTEPPSEAVGTSQPSIEPTGESEMEGLSLESSVFLPGDPIPEQFTCEGDDVSPPLSWQTELDSVGSFALIMEDPDAPGGTWTHWVLFNLPPDVRAIDAGIGSQSSLPDGTIVGSNSWGRTSYGGPCPPSGTHRYFFHLFALDSTLALDTGATSEEVREAMRDHILARAELMGTFSR